MLPASVKSQIHEGIESFSHGISILELGHRSSAFERMAHETEMCLRTLLNIPEEFAVLFMHGGGRGQFNAIPLNLLKENQSADYLITGHWSKQAAIEAKRFGRIRYVTTCPDKFTSIKSIPLAESWNVNPEASYFHYVDNETIEGIEFEKPPQVESPLISDMTSNLLTKPIDWTRYHAVYAATQKNLGIAGMTIVIVRRALLDYCHDKTPTILNYALINETRSLANTPPVFCWYVTYLVLKWALEQGGVSMLNRQAHAHSKMFYQFLDESHLFYNDIDKTCRSRLNIPFHLNKPELTSRLIQALEQEGLNSLKGHKVLGGLRASFYIGMPVLGVKTLIEFLKDFERKY